MAQVTNWAAASGPLGCGLLLFFSASPKINMLSILHGACNGEGGSSPRSWLLLCSHCLSISDFLGGILGLQTMLMGSG